MVFRSGHLPPTGAVANMALPLLNTFSMLRRKHFVHIFFWIPFLGLFNNLFATVKKICSGNCCF